MNPEIFAEWFRLQGQKVVRTASSFWVESAPNVYQAFPYHWLIQPSDLELKDFLKDNRVIALRYSAPWETAHGMASYHAVYSGPAYGLENLSHWSRKNVRRGLKNSTIEPLALNKLADIGWELQVDTLDRQGRKLHLAKKNWQRLCCSAADLPGFQAWGAWIGVTLAASVITFQMEDCIYMLYQQCLRQFLPQHVNNALGFTVTQVMSQQTGIRMILYGLHSLDAPPSVDEFKFRMGYTAKPVRQRVVFHPALAPFANPATHALLKFACRLLPGKPALDKAEGMVRFFVEGHKPLDQQAWPDSIRKVFAN